MEQTTQLKIFNVSHGFCAALLSKDSLILIDCGHDPDNFYPLDWIYSKGYRHIDTLIISNLDQDHISDIKAIRDRFTVGAIALNPTISADALHYLKTKNGDSITHEMQILINSMNNPDLKSIHSVPHRINDIDLHFYCVYFPHESDTNNLSLVAFIGFGSSYIIYPGDLERSGWLKLLAVPDFIAHLKLVNVFIASHHGRVNGYCKEVFEYCNPEVVIISDKKRVHATQDHDYYSIHASGINFGTALSPIIKKVMTTRKHGHLTLHKVGNYTFMKQGL